MEILFVFLVVPYMWAVLGANDHGDNDNSLHMTQKRQFVTANLPDYTKGKAFTPKLCCLVYC